MSLSTITPIVGEIHKRTYLLRPPSCNCCCCSTQNCGWSTPVGPLVDSALSWRTSHVRSFKSQILVGYIPYYWAKKNMDNLEKSSSVHILLPSLEDFEHCMTYSNWRKLNHPFKESPPPNSTRESKVQFLTRYHDMKWDLVEIFQLPVVYHTQLHCHKLPSHHRLAVRVRFFSKFRHEY
jgi:hypothetical protein